jgi:nicotinamidase/pyrazinamidase
VFRFIASSRGQCARRYSALDALELIPGVKVRFIEDASRGITPEGVAAAIDEMRGHGIALVNSADVLSE